MAERPTTPCAHCGEDFSTWPGEDWEGVWGTDGRHYCSGECAVWAWRKANLSAAERAAYVKAASRG